MRTTSLLVALVLAGCSATLTQAGRAVRLTSNAEVVRGCEFRGEVSASSAPVLFKPSVGRYEEEQTDIELRNAAAELGANTVLLSATETTESLISKRGEAYACP